MQHQALTLLSQIRHAIKAQPTDDRLVDTCADLRAVLAALLNMDAVEASGPPASQCVICGATSPSVETLPDGRARALCTCGANSGWQPTALDALKAFTGEQP